MVSLLVAKTGRWGVSQLWAGASLKLDLNPSLNKRHTVRWATVLWWQQHLNCSPRRALNRKVLPSPSFLAWRYRTLLSEWPLLADSPSPGLPFHTLQSLSLCHSSSEPPSFRDGWNLLVLTDTTLWVLLSLATAIACHLFVPMLPNCAFTSTHPPTSYPKPVPSRTSTIALSRTTGRKTPSSKPFSLLFNFFHWAWCFWDIFLLSVTVVHSLLLPGSIPFFDYTT